MGMLPNAINSLLMVTVSIGTLVLILPFPYPHIFAHIIGDTEMRMRNHSRLFSNFLCISDLSHSLYTIPSLLHQTACKSFCSPRTSTKLSSNASPKFRRPPNSR